MNLQFRSTTIPGTRLDRSEADGLTGLPFLRHLFLGTDGVMIATIRNISGIDTSTLQNWVKRGWVANSRCRKYDPEQVAHILIINMLRACMRLEHIDFILRYINGDITDTSDDIISESRLYDTICRILDDMNEVPVCDPATVQTIVARETADYKEPFKGARERLREALEIIALTYCAAIVKSHADRLLEELAGN